MSQLYKTENFVVVRVFWGSEPDIAGIVKIIWQKKRHYVYLYFV